jgi:hypothetical protein
LQLNDFSRFFQSSIWSLHLALFPIQADTLIFTEEMSVAKIWPDKKRHPTHYV